MRASEEWEPFAFRATLFGYTRLTPRKVRKAANLILQKFGCHDMIFRYHDQVRELLAVQHPVWKPGSIFNCFSLAINLTSIWNGIPLEWRANRRILLDSARLDCWGRWKTPLRWVSWAELCGKCLRFRKKEFSINIWDRKIMPFNPWPHLASFKKRWPFLLWASKKQTRLLPHIVEFCRWEQLIGEINEYSHWKYFYFFELKATYKQV